MRPSVVITIRSAFVVTAVSMMVSPHDCVLQVVRQVAWGLLELSPPLSHCSMSTISMMTLPQVSFDLQSAEQLSPDTTLPSSQTSRFVLSRIVTPQRCG